MPYAHLQTEVILQVGIQVIIFVVIFQQYYLLIAVEISIYYGFMEEFRSEA
jgi:hypothetical protein